MELLSKQQKWGKGPKTQGEQTRRGSGLEEDCKMDIEEETNCKKKLDERKKHLQRQLRDIEKLADMEQVLRDRHKEGWKEELQEIERRNTELLPAHHKMQKRCQKLQSLQDKKKKYLKDAGGCEEGMRMLHEENEERQARFQARCQTLSEKSGNFRKEADILEEEIQALQAEERRGSCASQSNGCCL